MRKIIFAAVACLGLIIVPTTAVFAVSDYSSLVRANCQALQSSLDSLQRHDVVARINRGRAYQDILDQMQALNTRLRNNSIDAAAFDAQSTRLSSRVDDFRTTYTRYDDLMTGLRQINCNDKPDDFVAMLAQVRTARVEVGGTVTIIEGALADYRQLVTSLQLAQPKTGGAQ